jgi:hypothetical protein
MMRAEREREASETTHTHWRPASCVSWGIFGPPLAVVPPRGPPLSHSLRGTLANARRSGAPQSVRSCCGGPTTRRPFVGGLRACCTRGASLALSLPLQATPPLTADLRSPARPCPLAPRHCEQPRPQRPWRPWAGPRRSIGRPWFWLRASLMDAEGQGAGGAVDARQIRAACARWTYRRRPYLNPCLRSSLTLSPTTAHTGRATAVGDSSAGPSVDRPGGSWD